MEAVFIRARSRMTGTRHCHAEGCTTAYKQQESMAQNLVKSRQLAQCVMSGCHGEQSAVLRESAKITTNPYSKQQN